ncbi:phytanoyl-CoA dioxygenase family protein [Kangiella sp. TOML190]|uniref:phytanoyl-CoA dioxygenase family protein n=1 Tax=Kangiella sp. TOML190 TaxID=2931351 RepID=UPI00203F871B|nr:phytanoyl-CoA dioxygenase family protein [Kangiella sp. TOML190]
MMGFFKEIFVLISRSLRKLFKRTNGSTLEQNVEKDGFLVVDNYVSVDDCNLIRELIDEAVNNEKSNVWRSNDGSDVRVHGINDIYPVIDEKIKTQELLAVGEKILNKKLKSYFIMAGKLSYVKGNLGSGGGWHRDSAFKDQYKVIIYLSNVEVCNGPFQYIKGSHRFIQKLGLLVKSKLPLSRTRFSEPELESSLDKTATLCANKGSAIFVNTKGIHRGKPISEGFRYALTLYCWEGVIPNHLGELLQNEK